AEQRPGRWLSRARLRLDAERSTLLLRRRRAISRERRGRRSADPIPTPRAERLPFQSQLDRRLRRLGIAGDSQLRLGRNLELPRHAPLSSARDLLWSRSLRVQGLQCGEGFAPGAFDAEDAPPLFVGHVVGVDGVLEAAVVVAIGVA